MIIVISVVKVMDGFEREVNENMSSNQIGAECKWYEKQTTSMDHKFAPSPSQ